MVKYSLEHFLKDCNSLGWYDSKVNPAWMDELDLSVEDKDLEKVLMYKEEENSIPLIMDYKIFDEGIKFWLEYMGHSRGAGTITNKEELINYMKVSGYDKGFIPKKISSK